MKSSKGEKGQGEIARRMDRERSQEYGMLMKMAEEEVAELT